jgi:diguanylate cyclase
MNRSSLRRQLVLPYVLLVVFVSATIGWVSYRTGENAVKALSQRMVAEMGQRIGSVTEQYLANALTVLRTIDPDPATLPRPDAFSDNLAALEARLWTASGLFMDVNNYVYFGGADGRFIGVKRINKDFVELYLREAGAARRNVYAVKAPGERGSVLRHDDYDPRQRPWYGEAAGHAGSVWSQVYNNFISKEPTITLAKAVHRADHSLAGVLATNIKLKALTDVLRTLKLSDNSMAFVIDADGYVIATSGSGLPFKMEQGVSELMHLSEMRSPRVSEIYDGVFEWKNARAAADDGPAHEFTSASGELEVAARHIGRQYGVDWTVVVAVPRTDFMDGVKRAFIEGIFIAGLCMVVALVLGLSILNRVLRDIRALTDAAKKIGNGEPLPSLDIRRRDEIGQLAQSFSEMEHNLRIDKLTAVFNRASLIAQIGFLRRQLEQKGAEQPRFALLFIDLDHFKKINDHYGHDAGDKALATVAARLKESVRVTDVVARYGGDEFVVLLKGARAVAEVRAAEEHIRGIVEEPVHIGHGTVRVGVSIGWAMFPEDGEDVDALLKIADMRMFDTKKTRKAAG